MPLWELAPTLTDLTIWGIGDNDWKVELALPYFLLPELGPRSESAPLHVKINYELLEDDFIPAHHESGSWIGEVTEEQITSFEIPSPPLAHTPM